jgi:hypothetical protein
LRRTNDVPSEGADAILVADAAVAFGTAAFAVARILIGGRKVDDAAASGEPEDKKQGHSESYELHRASVSRANRSSAELTGI